MEFGVIVNTAFTTVILFMVVVYWNMSQATKES